jgi:hypothetical protein
MLIGSYSCKVSNNFGSFEKYFIKSSNFVKVARLKAHRAGA